MKFFKLRPRLGRRRAVVICAIAAIASGAIISGSANADQAAAAPRPIDDQRCADAGADYERAKAEDMGMDPAKLQEAIDFWSNRASETVKVFRYNCLIGEGSLDPVFENKPIWIRSHTKTLVSLTVGRAQTLGLLDIDDPIGKYIPEGVGDAEHRAITFRDLLTMRSGLHMNWTREVTSQVGYDRVQEAMSLPFDHERGTWFEYAQIPMYLLPYATQHAVGMDFKAFAQKELFDPMGIPDTHIAWGRDRAGNIDGPGWNTWAWPNDFGRVGQLLLHEGEYNGQQLIDPQYLVEATTGSEQNPGYGMPFWLNSGDRYVNASIFARHEREGPIVASAPRDMYMTWGFHGQHTFVIPSLNMVVTRSGEANPDLLTTSDPGNSAIAGAQKEGYYTFFKLLMEAVADQDMPEPPPYTTDWTLDLDPSAFINPEDNLAVVGLGPAAADGCTILGCNGNVEYEGTVQFVSDLVKSFAAGTP
jgi:CubicO group peptidase (beta-lactamase class C family)